MCRAAEVRATLIDPRLSSLAVGRRAVYMGFALASTHPLRHRAADACSIQICTNDVNHKLFHIFYILIHAVSVFMMIYPNLS
jgi:hypothetical protein